MVVVILSVLLFGSYDCPVFAKVPTQNVGLEQELGSTRQTARTIPEGVDIPPPLAVALPIPSELITGPGSTSLSWRSRALALANEYPLSKDSFAWIVPVKYSKGQNMLREAIKQMGLELRSAYPESGQFLVSIPESNNKGQVIIVSQPVADNKTLFRMHVYSSAPALDIKRVSALPEAMKDLSTNKDLWQ